MEDSKIILNCVNIKKNIGRINVIILLIVKYVYRTFSFRIYAG